MLARRLPVLGHRILMAPEAELDGALPESVVAEAVAQTAYRARR